MYTKEEVSPENLLFANSNGDYLSLNEIIESKRIISVSFKYLSKGRLVKMNGWLGNKLGLKKEVWDEKIETISDPNGMSLKIDIMASMFFSETKEFEKIPEGTYDENSLWKQDLKVKIPKGNYQINFIPTNLIHVNWVNRNVY